MAYSCIVVGGEFNIGSALQYGEADIKGKDFSGQVNILPACISFLLSIVEGFRHNPSTYSAPYLPFTVTLGILFADMLDKGYSLSQSPHRVIVNQLKCSMNLLQTSHYPSLWFVPSSGSIWQAKGQIAAGFGQYSE